MAPDNQQLDFGNIESGQKRLEGVAKSAESPQQLKAKLAEYRKTYITEVNSQKRDLIGFSSTFKHLDAQNYINTSVNQLGNKVVGLASEGEKLQKSQDKPNFQSLDSLKTSLSTELSQERNNFSVFLKIYSIEGEWKKLSDQNDLISQNNSLANLDKNLQDKQALSKNLTNQLTALSQLPDNTLYKQYKEQVKLGLEGQKKMVDDDIAQGKQLQTIRAEAKKEEDSLIKLQKDIAGLKPPLSSTQKDQYFKILNQHTLNLNSINKSIEDLLAKSTGMVLGLIDSASQEYYQKPDRILKNLYDQINKLSIQEYDRPNDELAEVQLNVNKFNQELKITQDGLDELYKELEKIRKDPQKSLDRNNLQEFEGRVQILIKNLEAHYKNFKIADYISSKNEDIIALVRNIYNTEYPSTIKKANNLISRNKDRENQIKVAESKALNEGLEEALPKLEEQWKQIDSTAKPFLQNPKNLDTNSPEFQQFLEGESNLFKNLVQFETVINNLSGPLQNYFIDAKYIKTLQSYSSNIKKYLDKITNNRVYRESVKLSANEEGYTLVISQPTEKYVKDPADPKGRILERTEGESKVFKFDEYIYFIDPSDPSYKTANGGKGWNFKKYDLPEEVKKAFTLKADNLLRSTREEVESKTKIEKKTILSKDAELKQLREELGQNAENYFKAQEQLQKGNIQEAITLYRNYLNIVKNLPETEIQKHQNLILDAQNQIEILTNTQLFYDAMKLMSEKKTEEAINKLRAFIIGIDSKNDTNLKIKYRDQYEIAVEILRNYNTAKVDILEDLSTDLKYAEAMIIAKGLPSNKDLEEKLKKIEANSQAIARGEKPPFPPDQIKLNSETRRLLLPYLPNNILTEAEKKDLEDGRGGLQGEAITSLNTEIQKLRDRINNGEPIDFQAEINKLRKKFKKYGDIDQNLITTPRFRNKDGEERVFTVSEHLFDLFEEIDSPDRNKREEGYTKIAGFFKDRALGMKYTQKYLNKALFYRYQDFEESEKPKGALRKEIERRMNQDPAIVKDIQEGALQYYRRFVEENNKTAKSPEDQLPINPPNSLLLQQFQKQFFAQRLKIQYEREIRHKLTQQGQATENSALAMYNWSLPYNEQGGKWYKPWSWTDYTEDDWNEFKKESAQFAVETVALLPIAMASGAVGKVAFRGATRLLIREVLSEAAIQTLERGGLWALRTDKALWKALPPSVKRKLYISFGASLAGEGTTMSILSSSWESMASGHSSELFQAIDDKNLGKLSLLLLESMAKVGAYRAVGLAQGAYLQKVGGASIGRKATGVIGGELISGTLGTGVEAVSLVLKGEGDKINFDFWARSMIQNALQSGGVHLVHSNILSDFGRSRTAKKLNEARFNEAGFKEPNDIVSVAYGKFFGRDGQTIEFSSEQLIPGPLKKKYEMLRREQIRTEQLLLTEAQQLLIQQRRLRPHQSAEKIQIEERLTKISERLRIDQRRLPELIAKQKSFIEAHIDLDTSRSNLYQESKIVSRHRVNEKGEVITENVNLFKLYESKTSAYSSKKILSLTHEQLVKEGGSRIIKIGGDELVVYHAGPDGTIQKLFIDISNMGPTNSTATRIEGSRVNLVDIYLFKISEKINILSKKYQGKKINPTEFNQQIADTVQELFGGPSKPLSETEFSSLKREWNLEGDYNQYLDDISSMQILASIRADTRYLDSSYEPLRGQITFEKHIIQEIESISGMKAEQLIHLLQSNKQEFRQILEDLLPKTKKIEHQGIERMLEALTSQDILTSPQSSHKLMLLYSVLARSNTNILDQFPALKVLSSNLKVNRKQIVGEPPHLRVESPRLMDSKVVSIDLPPEFLSALHQLALTDPLRAQALLTAARTLSEKSLSALKYSKDPSKFAEFNIYDHIEITPDGHITIKKGSEQFQEIYDRSVKDPKVSQINAIELKISKLQSQLEALQIQLEQGNIKLDKFNQEATQIREEIHKLTAELFADPDTGAFSARYLDSDSDAFYSFDTTGEIPVMKRVYESIATEISLAGAINDKYGYQGLDEIMKGYHNILKQHLDKFFPEKLDLRYYKIIRSGGGKFEVVFLHQKTLDYIQKKGLTPESLISSIAQKHGQKFVQDYLAKSPESQGKLETDAVVRNTLDHYLRGKTIEEAGAIITKREISISRGDYTLAMEGQQNISHRQIIERVSTMRGENRFESQENITTTQLAKLFEEITRQDPKVLQQMFEGVFSSIDNTQTLAMDYRPLFDRLKKLQRQDSVGFDILRRNYKEMSSEYLENLISSNFRVYYYNNTFVRVYNSSKSGFNVMIILPNGHLAEGIWLDSPSKTAQKAHDKLVTYRRISSWGNEHIQKAHHLQDPDNPDQSHIILERSPYDKPFQTEMADKKVSINQKLTYLNQLFSVLQSYRQNGQIYGQLSMKKLKINTKESSLTLDIHAPIYDKDNLTPNFPKIVLPPPGSPEGKQALAKIKQNPAENSLAIDAYSAGYIMRELVEQKAFTGNSQIESNISHLAEKFMDIDKSKQPNFLIEAQKDIQSLISISQQEAA